MSKAFSLYLDLVRFVAACLVYLYHSNQRWLVKDVLPASEYGHSSVIVFFVLSGFVIAYITDTREKQFASYAASRLSRIYSVAIPAIVLTIALDAVGRQLYLAPYAYPFDNFLLRGVASVFLLNEVWFVSITNFSNVPYWSICYEMWYYVAFGMFMFLPRRTGVIAVALLSLALGPKVVLLAPIWMLGVLLYHWKRLHALPVGTAWILLAASCIGIVGFHSASVTDQVASYVKGQVGERLYAQFTFSKFFLTDYLLGVLVFLNFTAMRTISNKVAPVLLALERQIRFLASFTLSLYLLHQPLFLFWGAVVHGNPAGHTYWWTTTALVATSVLGVGAVTEARRHVLKKWIEKLLMRLEIMIRRRYVHAG